MDLFPLYNSIRIAILATGIDFIVCIAVAFYVERLPRIIVSMVDIICTLPLVLPPTVIGFLLILVCGPNRPVGKFLLEYFDIRLTMNWQAAVLATMVVIFPLMYRTFRAAFENYDETLSDACKVLNVSKIKDFWCVRVANCKSSILAGVVLAFARGLGEYGATSMIAGFIPGRTATIATTVYQDWRIGNDKEALVWIIINVVLSASVLIIVNRLEGKKNVKC